MRVRWLALWVVGVWLSCLGVASARGMPTAPVRAFTPRFQRIAVHASIYAAGDYQVITRALSSGPLTGGERVTNVSAHRLTVLPSPPITDGCEIDDVGPTALIFGCQQTMTSVIIDHLATGVSSVTSRFLGDPGAVGSDWLALANVNGTYMQYNQYRISYLNLLTGQILPDPRHIGGAAYPDLNSHQLAHRACTPIVVRSEIDEGRFTGPQSLEFFGDVGVQVNDFGVMTVQHCGSSTVQRFNTGSLLASNQHLLLWPSGKKLRGVLEPRGERISIALPAKLTYPDYLNHIALNDRELYVETNANQVWSAALPATLR